MRLKTAQIDGKILDVNSGDKGNNVTYYTYFNIAGEDYSCFTLQFVITNTTITLEATNDTAEDASANWVDVTSALTGLENATESGSWIIDTPVAYRRFRVKAVTTNQNNELELYLVRYAI